MKMQANHEKRAKPKMAPRQYKVETLALKNGPYFLGFIGSLIPAGEFIVPITQILCSLFEKFTIPRDIKAKLQYGKDINQCVREAIQLASRKNSCIKEQMKKDSKIWKVIEKNKNNETEEAIQNMAKELNEILSVEQKNEMFIEFFTAFNECLYLYPALATCFVSLRLEDLKGTFGFVDTFVGNEFLNKLSLLNNQDGMIRVFYNLFIKYLMKNKIPVDMTNCLARIIDSYNNVYIQYNSNSSWNPEMAGSLARILINEDIIKVLEKIRSYPLVDAFMDFVAADCQYFQGNFLGAIEKYKKLQTKFSDLEQEDESSICLANDIQNYLNNSIGWSYHKNGDNGEAIKALENLFNSCNKNSSFVWRYYRNYGVCLEKDGKYEDAIKQYENVIMNLPEGEKEYKIYITYCSAMMKLWDKKCEKVNIDKKWHQKAKFLMGNNDQYLCKSNIDKMDAYLNVAERKNSMFPGILIQRAKLITYEIFLSDNIEEQNELISKAHQLFRIARVMEHSYIGRLFVERDFYYAMWLLAVENNSKKAGEWLEKCKETNKILAGKGDAPDFEKIFNNYTSEELHKEN